MMRHGRQIVILSGVLFALTGCGNNKKDDGGPARWQSFPVAIYTDPIEAVAGADVVVTDTWVSMGKEIEKEQRLVDLAQYRVDAELMALAKPDALFLHCLPADRGYEVTAEVIDGPQSVIWDEAENRLHAQKALLVWLLRQQ